MTAEQLAKLHARASDRPWSLDSFQSQLAQSNTILEFDAHAFAIGLFALDDVELLQIATDPAFQRRGLAARVLKAFEVQAKAKGCTRGFLEVAESNLPAQGLYETSGWQEVGRRPNYYKCADGDREDAILMSKDL
ncbi:GNAT family N-acetyltransferase [Planktotalea sp.]|uniref:GNAT family N-acetyltransferase n=1 Tax=Planktotalea sp. TaxID=2029877 RepID=UPI003D6BC238